MIIGGEETHSSLVRHVIKHDQTLVTHGDIRFVRVAMELVSGDPTAARHRRQHIVRAYVTACRCARCGGCAGVQGCKYAGVRVQVFWCARHVRYARYAGVQGAQGVQGTYRLAGRRVRRAPPPPANRSLRSPPTPPYNPHGWHEPGGRPANDSSRYQSDGRRSSGVREVKAGAEGLAQ